MTYNVHVLGIEPVTVKHVTKVAHSTDYPYFVEFFSEDKVVARFFPERVLGYYDTSYASTNTSK